MKLLRQVRARLFTPLIQVGLSLAVAYTGAWLVGRVALGLTVLFTGLAVAADGFFRQPVPKDLRELTSHEAILERQRRAP